MNPPPPARDLARITLSVLVMLAYCTLGNLQFPLAGLAWATLFKNEARASVSGIAGLALLTAIGQRIGTAIFHWNFGYAWLYLRLPGAQIAEVFGFRGLCTLTICLNGLVLAAWLRRSSASAFIPLGLAIAIFGGVNAIGAWRLRLLPSPDAVARVLLIQPNVGNREKERLESKDEAYRERALEHMFALTGNALKAVAPARPDFAIWPENAFPGFIADVPLTFGLTPRLAKFLQAQKLNLITGAYGLGIDGKITNGLFALHRAGLWSAPAYEKQVLLPFGEYIPGAEAFPVLRKWLPDVRDYGRGSGTALLAAEETGRRARVMELDPGYCDVIVHRWEELTGNTAKRP